MIATKSRPTRLIACLCILFVLNLPGVAAKADPVGNDWDCEWAGEDLVCEVVDSPGEVYVCIEVDDIFSCRPEADPADNQGAQELADLLNSPQRPRLPQKPATYTHDDECDCPYGGMASGVCGGAH